MKVLLLIASVVLGGCAALSYMDATYDGIPQEMVNYHGAPWPVFNDAMNLRMLIIASGKDAALDGATLGLSAEPATSYRAVGQLYLDQHGLNCRAIGATLIVHGAYEVSYIC